MDLGRTGKSKVPKPPRVKAHWKKHGQNVLKLNVDARFREVEMDRGELIVAQALWYPHSDGNGSFGYP
jgi:hypothetical protein